MRSSNTEVTVGSPSFEYIAADNIVIASLDGVHLETKSDIAQMMGQFAAFWRAHAGGKKSYFFVDYGDFSFNLAYVKFYGEELSRLMNVCVIASFRIGGSELLRTGIRLAAMNVRIPSYLYDTREEAWRAFRAMTGRAT